MTRTAQRQTEDPQSEAAAPAAPASSDQLIREAQLEAKLEKLEVAAAAKELEFSQLLATVQELKEQLGRPKDLKPATLHIRGTSVNQAVLAEFWAKQNRRKPEEAPEFGKTFEVRPVGPSAKQGLPNAVVTNASDESDAKTMYCLHLKLSGATINVAIQSSESPEAN